MNVLVNNAGVFMVMPMTMTSLDDYMRIVTINQVPAGTSRSRPSTAVIGPKVLTTASRVIALWRVAG